MKNNRMETLKNNGVDTSKYFTLVANNDIPAGTRFNVEVETPYAEVAKAIEEDGYVKNSRLHRRFITAHYFRMLNSPMGWHGYLNACYDYMYQFKMMTEEVRVLSKLQKKDRAVFNERSKFFTLDVVKEVLENYIKAVEEYLAGQPIKHCKGKPYIYVKSYGNCFIDDLDRKIISPIKVLVDMCKKCYNYSEMYDTLCMLNKVMIRLPYHTKKSKAWVDAFQGSGAYYSLRNLVMYHDVVLPVGNAVYEKDLAVYALNELLGKYKGYQFNALLKKTVEYNNFDFKKSISK